jgi:single-stranded DNA-binding protein
MPEDPTISTTNLVLVEGLASGPPELRQLPSGQRVATFAVRTHAAKPPMTSLPVAVWDPPEWLEGLEHGQPIVVVGSLRRRFFRAATGGVASRVEIEAGVVGRRTEARTRRRARRLVEDALERLD